MEFMEPTEAKHSVLSPQTEMKLQIAYINNINIFIKEGSAHQS